jgi:hypothetical protein
VFDSWPRSPAHKTGTSISMKQKIRVGRYWLAPSENQPYTLRAHGTHYGLGCLPLLVVLWWRRSGCAATQPLPAQYAAESHSTVIRWRRVFCVARLLHLVQGRAQRPRRTFPGPWNLNKMGVSREIAFYRNLGTKRNRLLATRSWQVLPWQPQGDVVFF